MRIMQLAPVWETVPPPGYGGTEAVVSVLTDELVRRGHEVMLCASGDSLTSAELFSVVPKSLRNADLCDNAVQYAAVHVTRSLQQADRFDVVHNHNGPPCDLGMAMSHITRTPMLSTFHNQPAADTRFIWECYSGWYNTISRQQAGTIAPLPLAQHGGTVYNGVDVETFPFEREKEDYAFFLARMTPEKAPHLAIEAALKAGMRIILAGKVSTPEEHDYFDSQVRPYFTSCDVEYAGEADSKLKRELFCKARAQLVPLLWDEPFGLVMVEAMACGTPVIAFSRGAAPEIVVDGETGYLVNDVSEMAEALVSAEKIDPACCRAHVESNFSAAAMADRYLAMYEKMLERKEGQFHGYK